jgi:multiple sugar transport system substrate-binding protein
MMLARHYGDLNAYDTAGKPGSNPQLTSKDWAKAILTKQITSKTPEVTESLKLLKQFYGTCVTKNWSGITGTSGAMANIKDFAAGTAAMAWGTDYAPAALPGVKFSFASMPFPTITTDSTPLSTNAPAQFGISTGGTSYMIPAKISGDRLKAAIKFLQWMSVGKNIQQWLNETGAIPAVTDAHIPAAMQGFTKGAWGEAPKVGGIPQGPPGVTNVSLYDGFLLGSKNMSAEQSHLQDMWTKAEAQAVKDNGWTNESWAKNTK